MKRQRGRGRKSGNSSNRSLESNGPDVKIRGNASQIYEKYMQYARDAQTSGDRVRAENFLQHAEHYYRLMAASMPAKPVRPVEDENNEAQAEAMVESSGNSMKVMDEGEEENDESAVEVVSDETADADGAEAEPPKPRRRRTRRKPAPSDETPEDQEASSALTALAEEQAAIASNG